MTEIVHPASRRMGAAIESVRSFMRDHASLNRLTAGEEHSPRDIAWAIVDAISEFNATPPRLGNVSLETFPDHSLLVRGAAVALMDSSLILQARNLLPYNAGGLNVDMSRSIQLQMQIAATMRAQWEKRVTRLKSALNIEGALAGSYGLPSEYFVINGGYFGY